MAINEKDTAPAPVAKDEQLRAILEEKSGCKVYAKWHMDFRCYRYYFEKAGEHEWHYILDVYQGDVHEQTANELLGYLEKANWLKVIEKYAGKKIPFFMDKKFAVESKFHPWPKPRAQ